MVIKNILPRLGFIIMILTYISFTSAKSEVMTINNTQGYVLTYWTEYEGTKMPGVLTLNGMIDI